MLSEISHMSMFGYEANLFSSKQHKLTRQITAPHKIDIPPSSPLLLHSLHKRHPLRARHRGRQRLLSSLLRHTLLHSSAHRSKDSRNQITSNVGSRCALASHVSASYTRGNTINTRRVQLEFASIGPILHKHKRSSCQRERFTWSKYEWEVDRCGQSDGSPQSLRES